MTRIEFVAEVNDSSIEIPEEHRGHIHGSVRVIILATDTQSQPDIIDQLTANPIAIPDFIPLNRDAANARR